MSRYRVSIVIPLFGKVDYTAACLRSLVRNTPDGLYEVVLVDNGSTDATPALLDALDGDVQIIRNEHNLGFAVASNQGAAAARGRDILFLNNDTVAHPGWLEPLLAVLDDDDAVGAVGSRLLYPDGTIQHAGVVTFEHEGSHPIAAVHDHHRCPSTHPPAMVRRSVDVVTGACMLVRREALEQAGGLDEGYWNGNEDVDLCLTLRSAGWRVVYEPASVLVHHESVSGPERFRRVDQNVERLQERWAGRYLPPLLMTEQAFVRPHPALHPTVVWITDPCGEVAPASAADLVATVEAARRAVRVDDRVVVDERILPPDLPLPDGVAVAASHGLATDPSGAVAAREHLLTLAAGALIDRVTLDQLHSAFRADPTVRRVGPVVTSEADDRVGDASIGSHFGRFDRPTYQVARALDHRCILEAGPRAADAGAAIAIRVESARVRVRPPVTSARSTVRAQRTPLPA